MTRYKLIVSVFISSILLILLTSCKSPAQAVEPAEGGAVDQIGFACGFAGSPTGAVEYYEVLLDNNNYSEIRKNLYSSHSADQVLATLICEYLEEHTLLEFSTAEHQQMEINYQSAQPVGYCAGCIISEQRSVARFMTSSDYREEVFAWINRIWVD